MASYLKEQLQKAIRNGARKPLLICGSGVSSQATNNAAPSWAKLVESGIARVEDLDTNAESWAFDSRKRLKDGSAAGWISIADEITNRLGGVENAEFKTWLRDCVGNLVISQRDLLDSIFALDCPIATTNYDDILLQASGLNPILWADHSGTLDFFHGRQSGILYLHGHWQTPQSVVLGTTSYASHSADERRRLLQSFASLDRPTVFIGCSADGLADPDFSSFDEFVSAWKGVAERRYWLVRQQVNIDGTVRQLPSPDHDRRLLPLAFGTDFNDLALFLKGLGSGNVQGEASDSVKCIDQIEPRPEIFGRAAETEEIVAALLVGRSAIVAGGPGMGKTAVATASLYDSRIVGHFGRRRVFVSLESDSEPRACLVRLADSLGLPTTGDTVSLLRLLELETAQAPVAAVLDNAETVFETDRAEAERLINLLTQQAGLSLVLTLRGAPPVIQRATTIGDLPKLDQKAAGDTFLAIAGQGFASDPNLPSLLSALDGHALSIHLVAAQATGLSALLGLRESWEDARSAILNQPGAVETRLTSVHASLALTLKGRVMKGAPFSRRLLSVLAHLPAGLSEKDIREVLGATLNQVKSREAATCLRHVRLIEPKLDGRLRVLTPLRECIKIDMPLLESDRQRLIGCYVSLAGKAYEIGGWVKARNDLEPELDNLDPICEMAIGRANEKALYRGLFGLAQIYQLTGRGSVRSLTHAVDFFGRRPPTVILASTMRWLGEIARIRSEPEKAIKYFNQSLHVSRQLKQEIGEANSLQGLADMAEHGSNTELALKYYAASLSIYKKVGDLLGQGNTYQELGTIAYRKSRVVEAVDYLGQALALFEQYGSKVSQANCLRLFGEIALSRSMHAEAQRYFEKSFEIDLQLQNIVGQGHGLRFFGLLELQRGNHGLATSRFEQALQLCQQTGNVLGEALALQALGKSLIYRNDELGAKVKVEEALSLYRRIDNPDGIADAQLQLSELALRQGDSATACELLRHTVEASRIGRPRIEAEVLMRYGQAQCEAGQAKYGIENIRRGFAKLLELMDDEDLALPGWRLLEEFFTSEDVENRGSVRETIEHAWKSIERPDLINTWLP
jgi:tetratricopeptide (TPR) repeat protein